MENKSMLSQIIQTKLPETLYHYTSANGLMGIIESKKIWTTKIQYLNDKSELELALDLIRDEINQQLKGSAGKKVRTDEELNEMLGALEGINTLNVAVASFTENGDQLSQWRGYSEIGKGYSLGFNSRRLQAKVIENGHYLLAPCVYDELKQRELVRELINSTATVKRDSFAYKFLLLAPMIKSGSFHAEKEWRLISDVLDYRNSKFRSGNSSIIPYWEFDLDVDIFTSIIIGPTSEPDLSQGSVYGLLVKQGVSFLLQGVSCSRVPYRTI
jgi:hypothetical protein